MVIVYTKMSTKYLNCQIRIILFVQAYDNLMARNQLVLKKLVSQKEINYILEIWELINFSNNYILQNQKH